MSTYLFDDPWLSQTEIDKRDNELGMFEHTQVSVCPCGLIHTAGEVEAMRQEWSEKQRRWVAGRLERAEELLTEISHLLPAIRVLLDDLEAAR